MMTTTSPTESRDEAHVWVLSDGRPGHFNASRGILAALRRLRPVRESWIEMQMRIGAVRQLMRLWLIISGGRAPMPLFRACFKIAPLPHEPPDLIVSTGGNTAFLSAALARAHRCPNLFAGTLRGLRPKWFTAVITPFPLPKVANNIELEFVPTTIEPQGVFEAAKIYRAERSLGDRQLWSMIVGGDGGGYRFHDEDWQQLALAMNRMATEAGIQWLLTTSRRTGAAGEALLRSLLEPNVLADAVWWATQPRKVIAPFLGAAGRVFCTEDSATMLTEAMAAGKPVYSLAPRDARPDKPLTILLQRYADAQRLRRIPIRELQGVSALGGMDGFRLITVSMAEQLAEQLRAVLPPSWNALATTKAAP